MSELLHKKAPNFVLQNTEGKNVELVNYKGERNVVLLFFPLAFTSTCTKELCQTRDNLKMYNSLDAEVFGISVDTFFTLREFKSAQNINFQLLSDFNKEASKAYDVLYEDFFGMKGVSKRSVFIVDKEGVVVHSEILESADVLPNFKRLEEVLISLN
ncbi:MAG: redoxin domain-containing protein [Balneola sp.]|nr:redoxin domain-containing protein [Balneola sp.]MBO6650707.1 redoxin domain-containing protein [Balneola sp.]MBO6710619.1 redoxin domain-containing protein [Balneola sp.]MBO6799305.1 redoxin domain-containing protein [Balneola sp.]MBO6869566.1 redoxin domain-containing protein [Balneola sp.]